MTNGNIVYVQQFFHFIVILIDTSRLFITEHPALKCWLFCNELGAPYNISPKVKEIGKGKNNFWQQKQIKNKFWISKLYGCMFPGSPCCTWTETDGNILYLALLLLLGGDVTQLSLGMVNCSCRLHSKFHVFFFFFSLVYLLQMTMLTCSNLAIFCLCEVYSKSCIGLGLRAELFVLIPFHSSSCILTPYRADGGVGNSSFFYPMHHHLHMSSHLTHPTYHTQPLVPSSMKSYLHRTPVVFQFTSYYIFDSF